MLEKFSNIFRLPDLRKRIGFTLALLAVYRIGFHIPTPGVNADMLAQFFNQNAGSALGLLDLFAGGNLRRFTIFALGIMPYITASIIFQLLTVVYEPLAKMQKEGEVGRRKITQWTRYVTVLLAIVQSFFISLTLTGQGMTTVPKAAFVPLCMITLTCGTAFIMWLGEQITDRGVGNGMSLLIFTGIVVGLPAGISELVNKAQTNAWGGFTPIAILLLIVLMIAVVAFIIFVEKSERRIPIQSAKRMVGRAVTQASSSFLPLKVNSGGVMPVIFAASILSAPLLLANVSLSAPDHYAIRAIWVLYSALWPRQSPGMRSCMLRRLSFLPISISPSFSARMTLPTTCGSMALSSLACARDGALQTSSMMY